MLFVAINFSLGKVAFIDGFHNDVIKFSKQNLKVFCKFPVTCRLSFGKYIVLNFRIVTLRDIMIQNYLVEKNVCGYESYQSERFKYVRRCVHTHLLYFMSER